MLKEVKVIVVRIGADVRLLRETKASSAEIIIISETLGDMSELLGVRVNPVSGRCTPAVVELCVREQANAGEIGRRLHSTDCTAPNNAAAL